MTSLHSSPLRAAKRYRYLPVVFTAAYSCGTLLNLLLMGHSGFVRVAGKTIPLVNVSTIPLLVYAMYAAVMHLGKRVVVMAFHITAVLALAGNFLLIPGRLTPTFSIMAFIMYVGCAPLATLLALAIACMNPQSQKHLITQA